MALIFKRSRNIKLMAHNVLDGKALSGTIKEEIKLEVDKLKEGGYRGRNSKIAGGVVSLVAAS